MYCSFSLNNIGILRRLENAAARAITGNYDYLNMRGNVLFDDLRLVRFTDRYKYHLSMLMYKAVHGLVPNYLTNNAVFSHEIHGRPLRSSGNMTLYKPLPNYEIKKNALMHTGAPAWNALPRDIKCCTSLVAFKALYKTTYMASIAK